MSISQGRSYSIFRRALEDGNLLVAEATTALFGYDEFILHEVWPETLLASTPSKRLTSGQ